MADFNSLWEVCFHETFLSFIPTAKKKNLFSSHFVLGTFSESEFISRGSWVSCGQFFPLLFIFFFSFFVWFLYLSVSMYGHSMQVIPKFCHNCVRCYMSALFVFTFMCLPECVHRNRRWCFNQSPIRSLQVNLRSEYTQTQENTYAHIHKFYVVFEQIQHEHCCTMAHSF